MKRSRTFVAAPGFAPVVLTCVLGGLLTWLLPVRPAAGAPGDRSPRDRSPRLQSPRRLAVAAQAKGDAAAVLKGLEGVTLRSGGGALVKAWALEAQGRPLAALRVLERVDARSVVALHVLGARAALLTRLGRPRSAARLLAKVERSPDSPLAGEAALERAALLLQAHSPRRAARRFRWLRHRYPRYPDAARLLYGEASGLLMAGRFPEAGRLVRSLLLRFPAANEAVVAAGDLSRLRAAGVAVAPFSLRERSRRAVRLGRAGRVAEGLAELERLAHLPGADGARLALLKARVLMSNYRYADAVRFLDRARTGGRGEVKWEATRRLSTALRRAGRLDRLWRRIRARVTGAPGRPAGSQKTFWSAAKIQLLRGNRGAAARLLERAEPARRRGILAGYLAFRNHKYRRAERLLAPLAQRRRTRRAARYWLARTRLAQGPARRLVGLRMLRRLAMATPLDWYAVLARARLRQLTRRAGPTPSPVKPLPLRRSPHVDRLAGALHAHRSAHPRLALVVDLLRWGHAERGLAELRVVARDHLVAAGGRRGRLLRPISRWEAFGGVRHLAKPRRPTAKSTRVPRGRGRGPTKTKAKAGGQSPGSARAPGLSRVLYRAFRRLGDPYMANRFVRRDAGRPRLYVQTPYTPLVRAHARTASLQPGWVWAVMTVESAYCAEVVSHAGALGLLQIMPLTGRRIARAMGVRGFRMDQLFDPSVNIRFGVWYLGRLVRKFGGQLALAAAAYNGGPHNVEQWLRARAATAELDEFVEEIPMRETRLYVKKVVGLAARYAVKLGEPYAGLIRLKLSPHTVDCIDF